MGDGSVLTCKHVLSLRLSLSSSWKWMMILLLTSSRLRCRETHHQWHPKVTTSTSTRSMLANQKNYSLSSETSGLRFMEPELLLYLVGLTIYVQCYVEIHWGNSNNYRLNMVVKPITTSSLFRRVYLSTSSQPMRSPSKSERWGT